MFYNDKRNYHTVEYKEHHLQSLASYILLKKMYCRQQIKCGVKKYRLWLTFRNRVLRRIKKRDGSLTCFFCGTKNLSANHKNPLKHLYNGLATLDHYMPKSKGGGQFNKDNLVCACSTCNGLKADLMPDVFYNKIKDNPKFKGEFISYMRSQELKLA